MKHIKLNCDQYLMKMFQKVHDKDLIYIWIGALEEESSLIKFVRSLRILEAQASQTLVPLMTVSKSYE